jgi:hypothetical protein
VCRSYQQFIIIIIIITIIIIIVIMIVIIALHDISLLVGSAGANQFVNEECRNICVLKCYSMSLSLAECCSELSRDQQKYRVMIQES